MNENQVRTPWAVFFAGLVLGLAGGLYYAWVVNPTSYADVAPRQMKQDARETYVIVVGAAYLQDHDLERARRRLDALGERDTAGAVSRLADAAYLRGADSAQVQALSVLAEALGAHPLAAGIFSGTGRPPNPGDHSPTATFDAISTPTPAPATEYPTPAAIMPTFTATPVLIPANSTMKLIALETLCADDHPTGLIEIYVTGDTGGGVPAVRVEVAWSGSTDTLYTGLKREISPGYADFQMEGDQDYTVTLTGLTEPVVGLNSAHCRTPSGQIVLPTYQLVFAPAVTP